MSPLTSSAVLLGKPDAFLVALARRGSDAAFATIVARYRRALERHCTRFVPPHYAEDAVQQTFVRALQALRTGTEVHELRPWLYRIARNVALDELSRKGRDHDQLDEACCEHRSLDDVERRASVREALSAVAALPDRQRTALIRSAVDGVTPATIAAELGVTEGAARQLVHRARVSVRSAVAAIVPPPLLYMARRFAERVGRLAPAGAPPISPRAAAVVAAAIGLTAPAPIVLSHTGSGRAHHATAAATATDRAPWVPLALRTANPASQVARARPPVSAPTAPAGGAGGVVTPQTAPSAATSSPPPAAAGSQASQDSSGSAGASSAADTTSSDSSGSGSSAPPASGSTQPSAGTPTPTDPAPTDPSAAGSTGGDPGTTPSPDPAPTDPGVTPVADPAPVSSNPTSVDPATTTVAATGSPSAATN